MTAEKMNVFLFAHRANIDRYRQILKTELTVGERRNIERRLAEEEAALERALGHQFAIGIKDKGAPHPPSP